jgi:CubicO group peptidase (beta-lactamase class C family)
MRERSSDLKVFLDGQLSHFDQPGTPGCIIAVLDKGEKVFSKGYGRANVEFDITWTFQTKYRIASITKQFVGAAMLLLETAGKLSLDDNIRRYLPEMPEFSKPITIRHLLTMTSGIRHEEASMMAFAGEHTASLEDMYELVTRSPLHFETGNYALYSCANYRLAARIIERVTGQTFNDYLQENIFKPLGMKDSSSHPDYNVVTSNLTYLYYPNEQGYQREQTNIQMSGDGAMISTVNDLALWVKALQQSTLGEALTRRLTTSGQLDDGRVVNYGLGIGLNTSYRGLRVWEHSGSFGTNLFHLPDQDVSVIVFCNRMDINRWALVRDIADVYLFGESSSAATWLNYPNFNLTEDKLKDLQGSYVNLETGYTLTLELWRGVLRAKFLDGKEMLQAVSENEFISTSLASSLRVRIAEGTKIHADVGKGEWTKFQPILQNYQVANIHDYVGKYYNPELDISQTVEVKDSKLELRVRHGRSTKVCERLEPLAKDVFRTSELSLRFLRDHSGSIKGVNESINLARDVWFERWRARDG